MFVHNDASVEDRGNGNNSGPGGTGSVSENSPLNFNLKDIFLKNTSKKASWNQEELEKLFDKILLEWFVKES